MDRQRDVDDGHLVAHRLERLRSLRRSRPLIARDDRVVNLPAKQLRFFHELHPTIERLALKTLVDRREVAIVQDATERDTSRRAYANMQATISMQREKQDGGRDRCR